MNVEVAYEACEKITASQARNFYYGIKLLPKPKRQAMSALYALARRVDDIGDGTLEPHEKLAALKGARAQIADLRHDPGAALGGSDPVMVAMADASRRWNIPLDALEELVDGCEMDVAGTVYETFEDLVGYCRKVAGTIGRSSLAVYGSSDASSDPTHARELADDLGVALQLTNILRDVVEDHREMGRVYLPSNDLARFDIDEHLRGKPDDLIALISFEAGRACGWYERGLPLLDLLDRRSRACTAAMAGIYRKLLERIRRDPEAVLKGRISLSVAEKSAVALKAIVTGNS